MIHINIDFGAEVVVNFTRQTVAEFRFVVLVAIGFSLLSKPRCTARQHTV